VSTITESPIEPSSAAAAATNDATEDSIFTNFFNVCYLFAYQIFDLLLNSNTSAMSNLSLVFHYI
jgi:hypothetical protein